jgi:four helix bundle suffix protein
MKTHKAAGYKYLLAYKITIPIYDYTVSFCMRCQSPSYPDFPALSSRRTYDQMVQAARSGSSNIPEGHQQASLEGYIKLTGVNTGSLEELLNDFLAYTRHNKLDVWDKDRAVREVREVGEVWELIRATPTLPDSPNFPVLPDDPIAAVNLMITLINQALFLQKRLKKALEQKFVSQGGFRDNLFKKRQNYRNNS